MYQGTITNISLDYKSKKPLVTIELNSIVGLEELQGKKLNVELKEYKEKRGITANSAAWVMMTGLADKLNVPVIEIYKEYIKDINVYKQMTLPRNEFKTLSKAWTMLGLGWVVQELDITNKDEIIANFYYGSSTYNVNQMYKFLKNIIEDCKLQGIPTPEDKKIERMVSKWQK